MSLYNEYSEKGKNNIKTSKNDFIDSIGEEETKEIIKNVFIGGNVRDITEFITQYRLLFSYGSMLDLFFKDVSKVNEEIKVYSDNIVSDLKSANNATEKLLPLWLLGLTKKGLDNIVRTEENIDDYELKFNDTINDAIKSLEKEYGELQGTILLEDKKIDISWKTISRIMMAIGAQTLSIRGSAKSMNGKLFEKLVLGSLLTILGFEYCPEPTDTFDTNKKIFWLSHMDENERETDATIVNNKKAVNIDIGFIGRGNPEISLDKVTRFGAYKRIGGINHEMSTVVIVDTVGQNSDLFNKANRVGGKVLQMKNKNWIYEFSSIISEKFDIEDKLKNITENELEQFLDNEFKNICVYDFVNKNPDNN